MSKEYQVVVIPVTDENKDDLVEFAISRYIGVLCPYCEQPMTHEDLSTAITSDTPGRTPCHAECWQKHLEVAA